MTGDILKTLSSEELRDDLGIDNLRHRRDIGEAIQRLIAATSPVTVDALPEHGRILDHLSNVRSSSTVLHMSFKEPSVLPSLTLEQQTCSHCDSSVPCFNL